MLQAGHLENIARRGASAWPNTCDRTTERENDSLGPTATDWSAGSCIVDKRSEFIDALVTPL
jgi:hypothetical protein